MRRRMASRPIPTYFLYGEAPRRLVGPMLHVETIEARSSRHHWKIDPHLHQVLYQIVFVLRGSGVVEAEGSRAQFRPPALILMPAGSVHGFEFEPGTSGFVVSMSGELYGDLLRREPEIGALFLAPATMEIQPRTLRATGLARSFHMLAEEFPRSAPGHDLALHGWLEVMLANVLGLVGQRPNAADPMVGQRRQLVGRLNELIESRYRRNEPVTAFADALNVSESRLRNACVAMTGQTPIQLLNARILLEAKRQLLYTSHPVGKIAYALGFEDPAYFTRFFSRRAGVSPRAFRGRGPDQALASG
ncbi:MAG TPA: helix-turn-helix domain-containing protein [Steroidobacteraceae bacterium]|nr:helix-turn-helix domain-containing protein [Steroidobacteraceae bacterium]